MSKLHLIEFDSSDKLHLPGLLFEPDRKTRRVAIFLHGMASSVFYQVDRTNELGRMLIRSGVSYFTFNNRGAEQIKFLKSYKTARPKSLKAGMTFELIKDCIKDIDGAVKFLKAHGYQELYLIGHSTGANKICVYNYYNPQNDFKKYVLLGGGDDTGLNYTALGKQRFYSLLKQAKQKIGSRRGDELVPGGLADADDLFSYRSAYDILNADGDYNTFPFLEAIGEAELSKKPLFRHYKSIKKPTLVVYGENDEYCYGKVPECVNILKKQTSVPSKFSFKIIKDADHGFHGKEKELARVIASWL